MSKGGPGIGTTGLWYLKEKDRLKGSLLLKKE